MGERTKRKKSNPVLTKENTPVINAVRDALQGNKIWICKDDTIEVNRKPLEGFVATPGEGVSTEEHVKVLISAIDSMTEGNSEASKVVDIVFEDLDEVVDESSDHFIYPNLTDRDMWRQVRHFDIPENFLRRLAEQHPITQNTASIWIMDYLKYMYIKAHRPTSVPSENIGKVLRLHLHYTKSYGDLCAILENRIHYSPLDRVDVAAQYTEYERTRTRFHAEFNETPPAISWNGPEIQEVEQSVDPNKFFIIKKFW